MDCGEKGGEMNSESGELRWKTEISVCLLLVSQWSGKTGRGDTRLDWKRAFEWREMLGRHAEWLDVWNILSHFTYSHGAVEYLSNLAGAASPFYYDEKYMTKKRVVFIQTGWQHPQVIHCKTFRTDVCCMPLTHHMSISFFPPFFHISTS